MALLLILLVLVFGLGFLGGLPKWYRDVRENRLNCTDAQKDYLDEGKKLSLIPKTMMHLTRYVQGDTDDSFREKIGRKRNECLKV